MRPTHAVNEQLALDNKAKMTTKKHGRGVARYESCSKRQAPASSIALELPACEHA